MPSQLSLANFSRKFASLFRQKRSNSNSSKKNKSATKIQRTYRAHATRRKLEAKKLETQAEHLFCKSRAARAKAAKRLDDMARDVDEDNIDTMVYHLWRDLSNKEHAKWIAKAKKKLTQQNKNATINPVSE
jgi:hypothetical protein|uniref:Uncharacterized protein n=1 Tax=viral metagenome TaxID=1070528 RepID=A0A6C0CCT3_9ZZZZ